MPKVIRYAGFSCLLTAKAEVWGITAYLELVGLTTPTKAIWAALVSNDLRKNSSGIEVEDTSLHLERGESYRSVVQVIKTSPDRPLVCFGVLHSMMTVSHGVGDSQLGFLQASDAPDSAPPLGFMARLRASTQLPLLDEWQSWLWTEGQKQIEMYYPSRSMRQSPQHWLGEPVKEEKVGTFGVRAWRVMGNAHVWATVLRRHFDLKVPFKRISPREWQAGAFSIKGNDTDGWKIFEGERLVCGDEGLSFDKVRPFLEAYGSIGTVK